MKRWIGILIWTVVVGMGASLLFWIVTRDETYIGSDLTFTIGDTRTMNVSAPMMYMEAADDGFFAIRNGAITLIGKPAPIPLGWSENNYFTAELDQTPGGLWQIEKGRGITIHLVSESTMTVVIAPKSDERSTILFLTIIAGAFIWFIGLLATA